MRCIFFILIFVSLSSLANENFKPNLKCTNTSNSNDIVKYEKKVFNIDFSKAGSKKHIFIDDNGVIKELVYYRFYQSASDIFILSFSDIKRGEGYRFNLTEWGETFMLGLDTPENDDVSVGLDFIYTHICEEFNR